MRIDTTTWASSRPSLLQPPAALDLAKLSNVERFGAACVALPVGAVPLARRLPLQGRLTVSLALLAAAARIVLVFAALRLGRRLQKQAGVLVSERQAAVEGSNFVELAEGARVHYLLSEPPHVPPLPADGTTRPRAPPLLVHLNHGFGANAFTLDPLIESLGSAMRARAPSGAPLWLCAHDRLGFGLSSRPREAREYGVACGAALGLGLLDALPLGDASDRTACRTIFVGHSLGASLSARMAVLERARVAPRRLLQLAGLAATGAGDGEAHAPLRPAAAAIVLIAPALVAGASARPPSEGVVEAPAPSPSPSPSASPSLSPARRRPRAAALVAGMGAALGTASQASLLLLVRAIILPLLWSARFWKRGIGAAYADAARLAPPMLTRYRWPAQVAGADRGVACFVLSALLGARLLHTADFTSVGAPVARDAEARDAEARAAAALAMTDAQLVRALREAEVPVLIVHGTDDRLVPLSNSRRLAQQLGPLATLVELPGCGHCPQEEDPERVAEEVSAFLKARQVLE